MMTRSKRGAKEISNWARWRRCSMTSGASVARLTSRWRRASMLGGCMKMERESG